MDVVDVPQTVLEHPSTPTQQLRPPHSSGTGTGPSASSNVVMVVVVGKFALKVNGHACESGDAVRITRLKLAYK